MTKEEIATAVKQRRGDDQALEDILGVHKAWESKMEESTLINLIYWRFRTQIFLMTFVTGEEDQEWHLTVALEDARQHEWGHNCSRTVHQNYESWGSKFGGQNTTEGQCTFSPVLNLIQVVPVEEVNVSENGRGGHEGVYQDDQSEDEPSGQPGHVEW